ncbi:MAG: HAD family hydrolase [Hyphomicrobiaceae bacterium]
MRSVTPLAQIRGVLFDKDGTLLDYWKTWLPINREVALFAADGDVGLSHRLLLVGGHDPVTDAVVAGSPLAGGGVREIADVFAHVLGARTPMHLTTEIDRIFSEGGARTAVAIEGARSAVLALKAAGVKVGVATNDTVGGLEASLGRVGMLDDFDFLVASDSGHGAKPLPGMALAFSAATALDPSLIAVVGDSIHDLEMARRARSGHAIAVLSGTAGRADLAPHADLVLGSVCELPKLFGC